jgi:DNA-binding SARP family transcriptional activator
MSVLGGFELHSHAGKPIPLPPKKARALLAYLALGEQRPQPRDKLAALLWEDATESQARTSLRQALTAIRKALDAAEALLDADAENVWLKRDGFLIDAHLFQQCALAASMERLREAVELYRGSLLDGFDIRAPAFEDWLRAERERLRNLATGSLSTLVDHHMESANHGEALVHASRLLALDPLREEAHRSVMHIYAAQGRNAQAIEQYRRCREALRLELGVNPSPETEQLYREIIEQRRTPAAVREEPAPSTPAATEQTRASQGTARPGLRQAVVMLTDIDGFTALAGEVDPEDLHEFLVRYRHMVRSRVQEEGGTVTNYIQARVMAVFGVPMAFGNEAQRAVRVALDVRDEVPKLSNASGKPLQVRVGVASGPLLVTRDETGLAVTGEPISVAARVMESADGGEVRIAGEVRDAIAQELEAQHIVDATVPALRRPLALWRALKMSGAGPGRVFVGRQAELRQLEDLLAACAASRTGRAILIRGEAGIGKSRLIEELAAHAVQQGYGTHVAQNLEFGGTPDRPIIQLARSLLGVAAHADSETVAFALRRAREDEIVAPDLHPTLAELVASAPRNDNRRPDDTPDSANRVRHRHAVLSSLTRIAAQSRPLLIVAEDVHWADPITLDYLATLASTARNTAVVLAMTTRTESDPIGSAWRIAGGGCPLTTIDLGPLTEAEAMQLASQLARDENFARECVARAAGHPLFLDQLLRTGSAQGILPGSLKSLVLARLDRLAERERQALQAAAVLGQRFPLEALRHLLDDERYLPNALMAQGLLRPDADDLLFVHALIQEAVYGSIVKSQRYDLHAKAATWFSSRDPLLEAQHLGACGHPGAAAAHLRAALELAANHRVRQALDLAARGLGFASQQTDRCNLLLARGDCLRDLGETERSVEAFGEALHAAGNDSQRCRAWIGIAAGLRILDRYDRALAALDHALPLAEAIGDARALIHIHSLRGNIYFPLGDLGNCLAAHQEARRLALEIGAPAEEARALSGVGDAYYQSARVRTARDYYARCVKLARVHNLNRVEAMNLSMVAATSLYCGEIGEVAQQCRQALDQAIRIGEFRAEMLAYDIESALHFYTGDYQDALRCSERTLELARRLGARRFEGEALMCSALARHLLGETQHVQEMLQQAWRIAEETGLNYNGAWLLGVIALVSPDPEQRRQTLREGEALLARGAVSHNYFYFYLYAIDIALELGEWQEAQRYAAALESYTAAEPLTWTDLVAARGRVLGRWGSGERSASLKQEAKALAASFRDIGVGASWAESLDALPGA